MGLRLDPNCADLNFRNGKDAHYAFIHQKHFYLKKTFLVKILFINQSYGQWLQNKQRQNGVEPNGWDYSFIEFIRKAVECETNQDQKLKYLDPLRHSEAVRDFWTESIKELKPLIQFDPEPNLELKEAKVELYKISISFSSGGMI